MSYKPPLYLDFRFLSARKIWFLYRSISIQCPMQRDDSRITTTRLFLPSRTLSEDQATICSHKLMLRMGIIRKSCSGIYHLMPMGYRALEKLITLIDQHMQSIGAVKMAMPIISSSILWKESGRWDIIGQELFRLMDRQKNQFCLGPTHEEVVTNLVKEELVSKRQLPLKLYQLDRKFRDEIRPRFGLLRAREFWMKDMYTFDMTERDATDTYEQVCECYERIIKQLDLPSVKVKADPGNIGGSLSHEYHIPSAVGENVITQCETCKLYSGEVIGDKVLPNCPHSPDYPCCLKEMKGIEVAHTFFLGTRYSDTFDLQYVDHTGNKSVVQMGCYGIGVSRVLAAAIEHGCTHQSERLIWPNAIAPYTVCILSMANSPDDYLMKQATELYDTINCAFPGDVVLEDRLHLTLGARLRDLTNFGYPVSIIVGKKAPKGEVEVCFTKDSQEERKFVPTEGIISTIQSYIAQLKH